MKWPVVSGTIKLSDIEQYRASRTEGGSRGQVMYQRRMSYTYKCNNLTYANTHASSVASTSSWLVRKSTTDYKNGATVKVWVNPDNPAQATLEPRTGFVWVIYGWQPRRSGSWRITLPCMAKSVPRTPLGYLPPYGGRVEEGEEMQ